MRCLDVRDVERPVARLGGHLDLGELVRARVRVTATPGPSLFALAADVVGAGRGVSPGLVARARAELEPIDLATLAAIGQSPGSWTPGFATTIGDRAHGDVAEAAEWIATLPVETLLDDLLFAFGPALPVPWDAVVRHPRAWLVRYARALTRVWRGVRQQWNAVSALRERESERVACAAGRGALPSLVAGLHHEMRVRDGRLHFVGVEAPALHLPERGLNLTPLLTGPGRARVQYADDGTLVSILYPLPGMVGARSGELGASPAGLEALIGAQRTRILRLLDRPRPAGRIAQAIGATPGAVTYQLRALEASGLILRERAGRQVAVSRTSRGAALLSLYD
jgi:DNA-binding transcriptional ArsR family regulator